MLESNPNGATQTIDFGSGIVARNRMFFASMGLDLCDGDGLPKDEFFALYESLIDGGCGFGYLCNASVDAESQYNSRGLKIISNRHADALKSLFSIAKSKNIILGLQLQHYGSQGAASRLGAVAMSPSDSPPRAKTQSKEMSEAQIKKCIDQFASAALLAQRAGAPVVQLQAANGYLLSSFLSPRSNRRTDAWGGTPRKRAKILIAIIEKIYEVTNGQLAVSVRLGINDGFDGHGQKPELLNEVVFDLQDAGAVSIECSVGVSETFKNFFTDSALTLADLRRGSRLLKRGLKIPVGFTGSVTSVSVADEIVTSGDADFVGFARAVLADNHLVSKELSGRHDLVHRCLGDAFCFRDKKEANASRVYCCVNPDYLRPQKLQKLYEGKGQ